MADINSAAKRTDVVKVPKTPPSAGLVWKPRAVTTTPPSELGVTLATPQNHTSRNLPNDPTHWPDDWRYEFIERSGMLFNTGVTLEEADKTAEALVREHHAQVSHNGQLSLLEDDPS